MFGGYLRATFHKTNAKRQMYAWGVYNKEAQDFVLKVFPWLSGKRSVAQLALVPTFGEKSIRLSSEEKQLRGRIEEHIHAINQRVTRA